MNVILSIALVVVLRDSFGEEFGMVGVILATIITNLTICHAVEPYVLFRYAFQKPVRAQLLKSYGLILLFFVVLLVMHKCLVAVNNPIVSFFINGIISVCFSGGIVVMVAVCDKDFRSYIVQFLVKRFGNRIQKKQ